MYNQEAYLFSSSEVVDGNVCVNHSVNTLLCSYQRCLMVLKKKKWAQTLDILKYKVIFFEDHMTRSGLKFN